MRASDYSDRKSSVAGGLALVALASALWGSDGLFRRGLALELPAAVVVFAEHLILVLLTFPLLLRALRVMRCFDRKDWAALTVVGAGASAAATMLFTQAFLYGGPNTPILLQKLQPVFAVAGAHFVLGERLLPRFGLYFVCGVSGAYLIAFPAPLTVTVSGFVPAALAVSAAALWGLGTVFGRHLTAKVDFKELTALRFAVGLPVTAAILVIQGSGLSHVRSNDAFAVVLLALIPGLFALLVYYRGLRETPAAAATLAELAFPLSAVTVNYLAFEATLTPSQWAGLVLLSVTIVAMGLASTRGTRVVGIELPRHEEAILGEA